MYPNAADFMIDVFHVRSECLWKTSFCKRRRLSQPHHSQDKIEFIIRLNAYLVDLGDNGVPMGLIYLNTFWNNNVIYDEYCYLLAVLHLFTLDFFTPVATVDLKRENVKKKLAQIII